jgi:hypothetical protein
VESVGLSVTTGSILVRDGKLAATDLDGRTVVLSLDAGAYFDFNEVASEIWRMLAEPCRVDDIFRSLAKQHGVHTATLTRDVAPFLQQLMEHGLVRRLAPDEMR